ncbi:JAB domain-containing protein [Bacteroides sp.]|uniref:JAB domain-containing protein n=1 Tax=Bacteroides sp. TaxID=29523 RepID=UPI002624BE53|nr:JAB domain-containing protein [Bacteroides sp.]MDD3040708.1 JAB domain-containing protein [Bacteroides sp.]
MINLLHRLQKFLNFSETNPLTETDPVTYLRHRNQEQFIVVSLDNHDNILEKQLISIGTATHCIVHPRDVFRNAIHKNAYSIILYHNHPYNTPIPSVTDIQLTEQLTNAGTILNIQVKDHIIVTNETTISIKTLYPNLFS